MKVILFDIDGVLIHLPFYFSKQLEDRGYKLASVFLNKFFHSEEYSQALVGKADAKKLIEPYLERIKWEKGASEYFIEQFNFEIQYFDRNILSEIEKLSEKGIKCFLCTDQEQHRLKFLIEKTELKSLFSGCFASSDIGFRKYEKGFWEHIIKNNNINPSETIFFDDKKANIDIAQKEGIKAFLFTDFTNFKKNLFELGFKFYIC
ncbi:MAG: HAD-IA family hydrolase [Candidatus Pacebacteria bacterium]|nr:HAD-IA family hydrolase [Candidatus Paceibacterota bacterium]